MELSRSQATTKAAIVEYGRQHGFSDVQIQIASEVAYIESSFGVSPANATSTASGLFRYTDSIWNDFHSDLGSKDDSQNQIVAFYRDLATYSSWYEAAATKRNIPDDLTLGEYVYVNHHDGRFTINFAKAPGLKIYRDSVDALFPELREINPGPYPGALAMYADTYIGNEVEDDSAGCIKLRWDGVWYIDYHLEPLLSDDERQSIVDKDPNRAFYISR